LFGRELLQQGLQWGIGNGIHTKILSDRWILDLNLEFVKPLTPLPEAATVDFLIDEVSGTWNDDLVHSIFEEETANKIF
jgi:hypothetical protein